MNSKGGFILTAAVAVLAISSMLPISTSVVPQQAQAREEDEDEEEQEKLKYCFTVLITPEESGGEGSPPPSPQDICTHTKKECEQTRLGYIGDEFTQVLSECFKKKIHNEDD